jgi:hypothetical protein
MPLALPATADEVIEWRVPDTIAAQIGLLLPQ